MRLKRSEECHKEKNGMMEYILEQIVKRQTNFEDENLRWKKLQRGNDKKKKTRREKRHDSMK